MSSRFSALITGIEHKKGKGSVPTIGDKGQSQTNGEKRRPNIFQQKPKPSSTQQNHHSSTPRPNNQFKKPSKLVKEFKTQQENFPTLSTDIPQISVSTLSYSEKIKRHEEKTQNDIIVPKGYIILANMKPKPKQQKIMNEYYNPAMSKLIMNNRKKEREELNELLGSMSPYWYMYRDNTDDDDENDTSNPDILSEDEDQEYFDEW